MNHIFESLIQAAADGHYTAAEVNKNFLFERPPLTEFKVYKSSTINKSVMYSIGAARSCISEHNIPGTGINQ